MAQQSKNERQEPKHQAQLDKAKSRALTHEVHCFDQGTAKYEVIERGGTTANGEVRPSKEP